MAGWRLAQRPRRWQQRALDEWRAKARRGIAQVVTGGGKTIFAEMCLLDFLKQCPHGQAVIVVPTVALLDQWHVDLQEDLGVGVEEIAVYSGESKPSEPAVVNLMVLNTAREFAPRVSELRPTFLIVDECHRAAAPMNARALRGRHAAVLGLSATPEREYDEGLEEVLVPALGPIVFRYDYAAARAEGVITDFSLINVAVDLLGEEQAEYARLTRRVGRALGAMKRGEDVEERLKVLLRKRAAIAANARMRIPVAAALAESHRGQRMVIFHERIPAAEELYSLLERRNHNVTLYHSRIAAPVRRDNLRLFRRGVFGTLISCRALDEGVNVPETEVGIIASSTASTRQRIQRLGRVLRPAPGKEHALVYTLFATEVEERRLREEASKLTAAAGIRWQAAGISNG